VDGKKKTSRVVYRDEAADLMEAAARNAAPAGQLDPPTIEVEARRVLPYPEPVGTNDNIDVPRNPSTELVAQPRKRGSAMRTAAIVLLTPWYVVVTGASLGLIFLFVRGLVLP
jgi:hypothetical protein